MLFLPSALECGISKRTWASSETFDKATLSAENSALHDPSTIGLLTSDSKYNHQRYSLVIQPDPTSKVTSTEEIFRIARDKLFRPEVNMTESLDGPAISTKSKFIQLIRCDQANTYRLKAAECQREQL